MLALYLIPLITLVITNIIIAIMMKRDKSPIKLGWTILACAVTVVPGLNVIAVVVYMLVIVNYYSVELSKILDKEIL